VSERQEPSGGSVRPPVALAFATATFIALLIFGLGMLSLLLGEDVIEAPGLGQIPGVLAVGFATVAFAGSLWAAVRMPAPSFWGAAWTTAATFIAYLLGVWLGAVTTGADLAVATAVAGRIATTWFGVVVAGAALIAAWGGIALVRTRARRPRWPWEDEFDE
jgi:hypothetical protein